MFDADDWGDEEDGGGEGEGDDFFEYEDDDAPISSTGQVPPLGPAFAAPGATRQRYRPVPQAGTAWRGFAIA